MSEAPQGHFLLGVGSIKPLLLQLVASRVFIKLHGEKHTDYRAKNLHPAGPIHASETGTQQKDIQKTLLSTYIPFLYLNLTTTYHMFSLSSFMATKRFTKFGEMSVLYRLYWLK